MAASVSATEMVGKKINVRYYDDTWLIQDNLTNVKSTHNSHALDKDNSVSAGERDACQYNMNVRIGK